MGALTLSQYQTRVRRMLGNLGATHPVISDGLHTEAINHAANRIIRMVLGGNGSIISLFPEHNNNSWTTGPTIVGDNYTAAPDNCLFIERITRPSDDDTPSSNPGDGADTTETIVSRSTVQTIGLLSKSSSDTGYPRLWARKGNNILYYPTTRTGYTSYLRIYGVARETYLSAAGDTFRLHEDWDSAIVELAASEVAMTMGWSERSKELLDSVHQRIVETANIEALGDGVHAIGSDLEVMRADVYGGFE